MSRKAGPPQARPAKGGRIKEKRKLKAKHTSEAHCPLNKKRFRRGACNSPKRNTEKSSYTTAHDLCDQFVEEHSSPRRRGPRAGAAQQLGAFVCGQLAPVVSLAYVSILKGLNVPLGLLRACAANRLGRHSLIHERVSSSRAIMGGRSGLSVRCMRGS